MRRIAYILLPLLLAACATKPDTVELTGWQFEYNGKWYPATVPGFIHTDLMANGLIPDPYLATNEDSVQWVGNAVWKYRTTITRDMWEGYEHCELVLQGITMCDVSLSGETVGGRFQHLIASPDNMFREYRADLFDIMVMNNKLPDFGDTLVLQVRFYPIEFNNESHFATEVFEADGYPWPDMEYDLPFPRCHASCYDVIHIWSFVERNRLFIDDFCKKP